MKQPGRKHRAGVPRGDDRIGLAVTDRPRGANERGVGLRPHCLGRLVVHLDHAVGDDVRETERIEPGGTEDDRLDLGGGGVACAGDDLLGPAVTPERVDGDANRHRSGYGAGVRRGLISRPRYVLQLGHMWCGCFGDPQVAHTFGRGASMLCWARRLSRRAFDVFRFGTAMSGWQV